MHTFPDDEDRGTDMVEGHEEGDEVTKGWRGVEADSGGCRCAVRWRGEARWEEIQEAIVWREKIGTEPRERQLRIIHHRHTEHQSDIPNWSPDRERSLCFSGRDAVYVEVTLPANIEQWRG